MIKNIMVQISVVFGFIYPCGFLALLLSLQKL